MVVLFLHCLTDQTMRFLFFITLLIVPAAVADSTGFHRMLENAKVLGVDVSRHQKQIDWEVVAAKEPIHFAFVKATEGSDFQDTMFCHNWEKLGRMPLHRGAYHFFRGYGCGYEQARHFLTTVEMRPGDLPPVLDIETLDETSPEQVTEQAKIWLETVEQTLGIRPIVYSNQRFYERFLAGTGIEKYPLWIARYHEEHPVLKDGRWWTFWQYSNEGCVEGISEKVDMNVFPGTLEMLEELCWEPAETNALP